VCRYQYLLAEPAPRAVLRQLMACNHEDLSAKVDVEHNDDGSLVKLRISCSGCGTAAIFPGLESGRSTAQPMASADGTEARLPITFAESGELRCPHCGAILFGEHIRAERPTAITCGADHVLLYSDGTSVGVGDSGNWLIS
jgi:hypothetical protein